MVDGRTPLPHGAQYSANSAAAMRTRRLDRRGYGLGYRWHPSGGAHRHTFNRCERQRTLARAHHERRDPLSLKSYTPLGAPPNRQRAAA